MGNNFFEDFGNISDDDKFREALKRELDNRIKKKNQNNYKINRPQWAKMISVLEYLIKRIPAEGKSVEPPVIIPSDENGDVLFQFDVLFLDNIEQIIDFAQALECGNRVVFDATASGKVCVDIMIYKVFIPKEEEEREVL